jgi:hypothetical protein
MKIVQPFTPGRLFAIVLGALLALPILLALMPAGLGLADAPTRASIMTQVQPGNQCVSCHTPGDDRLANATAWTGNIQRETISPCPALSRVHEEIYYTDRMLLAIDRARAEIPGRFDASKNGARLDAARQTYSRILDRPVSSLDAVSSEASVLRFRLGKIYTWLNQVRESVKRQWVLIIAAAITLILLVALGLGMRNISRYSTNSKQADGGSRFGIGLKAILFLILLFILFSLPIFRVPAQEIEDASEEEQARQTALDTAGRVADATDRALARAWAMARVGAAWQDLNQDQAENALDSALTAAEEIQMNAPALWGEAQAAYEGTIGSETDLEQAHLVANQVEATNSRAWALRLVAHEWLEVDPAVAETVLEEALTLAAGQSGLYRELDLRGIAVTWARLDPDRGLAVANRMYDPALRAWALREIAAVTGQVAIYDQAAEAAREVSDPVDRARTLREIAFYSGNEALFDEALAALEEVEGVARAYALSDLAAASSDPAIAEQIDPAYPDARAAALYRQAQFDEAWAAAAEIEDPFGRAHAQSAIAGAWQNLEAANQIADPTLRDRALRNIAIAQEDATLAAGIESPYYRIQALTGLGRYQQAAESAENLSDAYPLRDLAVALAESDPDAALAVVDLMTEEADKAEALRAIAVATGDDEQFERALNLALAARVRGDSLAPVEASLALARAFEGVDSDKAGAAFAQAYEIAERISTKYK